MPSSINSSKKRAENNLLNDSLIKQTITQMGFEKNKIPKFEDGIYIVYRFRIGKNPATNVDWLWYLNPYYLSFQLVKT